MPAAIRVPANVSTMTFAGSGVIAAVSRIVSGLSATELTALTTPSKNDIVLVSTASNGNTSIKFPPGILTSITINATPYVPNGTTGIITGVPAADATAFFGSNTDAEPFQLVTGN